MTIVAVYCFLVSNESLKPIIHLLITLVTCSFCLCAFYPDCYQHSCLEGIGVGLLLCKTTDNTRVHCQKHRRIAVNIIVMFVGCFTLYVTAVYCCYIVCVFLGGEGRRTGTYMYTILVIYMSLYDILYTALPVVYTLGWHCQ